MYIVTHYQIRGARTFLGLTQKDVSDRLGLSRRSMMAWESGSQMMPLDKMKLLIQFYQDQGIEFLEDEGFVQRKPVTNILSGESGFESFFSDVYKFCKSQPSREVCVLGVNESSFMTLSFANVHVERMAKLNTKMRVIVSERPLMKRAYAEYRIVAQEYFENAPIYIFDNSVGIIDWEKMQILYIHSEAVALAFLKIFNMTWGLSSAL